MHEWAIKIIHDVFKNYPEFVIETIKDEENEIWVTFSFHEKCLFLILMEPDDVYLRNIHVLIGENEANELHVLPHRLRLDGHSSLCALCLLEKEQFVLTSYPLAELVDLYVGQTFSLLNLSGKEIEAEYLKEFEYYWNLASRTTEASNQSAQVYLPYLEKAAILDCWFHEVKKYGTYVICPQDVVLNDLNIPEGSVSKALYIPIAYPDGVVPPQQTAPWTARDLLDIVYCQTRDRISDDTFKFLNDLTIDNYQKVIVFSFHLPASVTMTVTGILKFTNKEKKSFINKLQDDFLSFIPIRSNRMDLKYLHERVGQNASILPSILVIGCGSVGSYLLPELVNIGFTKIGISDPDYFESGNALRHYLGPKKHGKKKVDALKEEVEHDNPLVHVKIVPDLTKTDDKQLAQVIGQYRIVIVAVGGTDIQRNLNNRFSGLKTTSWFLYNWLDAEGKGAHVLAMRYNRKGCYNCLFYDQGEFTPKCKASFSNGTEKVISNGCGGSFSPYGNNVLIRNTALTVSMLQGVLSGTVTENTVASIQNDFTSLESSMSMVPIIDCSFAYEGCEVCGHIQ